MPNRLHDWQWTRELSNVGCNKFFGFDKYVVGLLQEQDR
jgi:hypothetical protein